MNTYKRHRFPPGTLSKAGPQIKSATVAWVQDATSPAAFNLNYQWTTLDDFPTDIPGHRLSGLGTFNTDNSTNNDDTSSNANRVNLVTWYDF